MFFYILLVAIVFCAIVLYLPYSVGLTQIERQHHEAKAVQKKKNDEYTGYIPPDEELRLQEQDNEKHGLRAKASALKEKMHVTSGDMPVRIRLNQGGELRKRKETIQIDKNPNTYDYDLDELIEEETEGARQQRVKEFYAEEAVGGDKEAMV